tara:strand:- start:166 stop:384 length:219 start_codon:yes stop_codon:yes gene_type:complete
MGSSESMYRITRTDEQASPWVGFCTVVRIDQIGEELQMPNGERYKFMFVGNRGLRITEGEHKGYYDLEPIYQ